MILAGSVLVSDRVETRVGYSIPLQSSIRIREKIKPYVSRGAQKLLGALENFPDFPIKGRLCWDLGASTGGFTQVLLEKGARQVLAVDVGYGQLVDRLRQDPRVIALDRTHAKELTWDKIHSIQNLPGTTETTRTTHPTRTTEQPTGKDRIPVQHPVHWEDTSIVMDLSFISITQILPHLRQLHENPLSRSMDVLALLKPQFELDDSTLLNKGVLEDQCIALRILRSRIRWLRKDLNAKFLGVAKSSLRGADGNQEYFIRFGWSKENSPPK